MVQLGTMLGIRSGGARYPTWRWLRWLAWLSLAFCILAVIHAHYHRTDRLCSVWQTRALGEELKQLAKEQRQRVRETTGLARRQAAEIAVNAEYILETYKPLDRKRELDEKTRKAVQDAHRRLFRAARLSESGADRLPETGGAKLRAYVSSVDGTIQPYSVTIPKAYDPAVPWPLIVDLHGHGWFRPFQGHPAPGYDGAFGLAPTGRGATDYRELGELDVLRCIAEVKRDFRIDDDRVYIRGGSMGGTGAWYLGTHYADQFAGILPICGNSDNQAWTLRWGWNREFPGRFDDLRNWIQDSHSSRPFAANLRNLPTFVIHGSGDVIVPPEHSRETVAELRRLGAPVEYRECPNKGHGGLPGHMIEEGLAWLCAQPRVPFPKRVTWKADRMRHGKAYWVRMDQKAMPTALAEIDAEATDGNHIVVSTVNLRAFSILRRAPLFDTAKPLFLLIDGERVIFPPARDETPEWVELVRTNELGWRDASRLVEPPFALRQRAGLEGPIAEALLEPFVLVQGTKSADEATRLLWEREANRFRDEWKRRNLAPCLRVTDSQLTDDVVGSRNLILFGGPEDNSVTARLVGRLPIDDILAPLRGRELLRLDSGLRTTQLSAEDVGYFLVYPNPENPDRLVVVWQANGPAAIYQGWGRFGNWFNWGVYDSRKYFDYAVYDSRSASPETLLLLGWFGTDWTVRGGVSRIGVEALRETMAPQHFPGLVEVPATGDVSLYDLRPTKIDQMRGAIGLGRTFQGLPLEEGIGVRAPAVVEYEIGGGFRTFTADVVLLNSPETNLCLPRIRDEKIRFKIKGDGEVLAEEVVSWSEPTKPIKADVTDVKKLVLEVQPAGGPAWLHAGAGWSAPTLSR
jgi:pimeloyl-ACP methyl ester carboxylesterase